MCLEAFLADVFGSSSDACRDISLTRKKKEPFGCAAAGGESAS